MASATLTDADFADTKATLTDSDFADAPSTLTDADFAQEDQGKYGLREDGTKKGRGFLGELRRPDGDISTEISIGVNMDGKEMDIPSLVPTLDKSEVDHLLSGGNPTEGIVQKAVDHAKSRISQNLSPFRGDDETTPQEALAKVRSEVLTGRDMTGEGTYDIGTGDGIAPKEVDFALDKPLIYEVPRREHPEGHGILPEAVSRASDIAWNTTAGILNFVQSPLGIGIAGVSAAAPAVGAAIATGFAAHGAKDTPDALLAIKNAKTPQERDAAIERGIMDAAMVVGGVKHGTEGLAGAITGTKRLTPAERAKMSPELAGKEDITAPTEYFSQNGQPAKPGHAAVRAENGGIVYRANSPQELATLRQAAELDAVDAPMTAREIEALTEGGDRNLNIPPKVSAVPDATAKASPVEVPVEDVSAAELPKAETIAKALEDSAAGKKQYGIQAPEGYTGGGGPMSPAEAEHMEASKKIFQMAHEPIEIRRVQEERGHRIERIAKPDVHLMDIAEATMELEPKAAQQMVDRINAGTQKVTTDIEEVMLARELIDLHAERDMANERIADPDLTDAERKTHEKELKDIVERINRTEDAIDATGSEMGAGFRARRLLIAEDYSLRGLSRKARKGVKRDLSAQEIQEYAEQAKEVSEANKELAELADAAEGQKIVEEADAKVDAYEKQAKRESDTAYSDKVMEHARSIVERAEADAAESWKEIRRMFGSESGSTGGVGGPKGEGRKMGSAERQSLIVHAAKILKAKVYRGGVSMASAVDTMLFQAKGELAAKIRPLLSKIVAKANAMMEKELSGRPTKVKEAVKTGAASPERVKKVKTKDELVGMGKADVEAKDGLTHKTVAAIVNGFIDAGIRDRAELFKKTHEVVKEFLPDATERDVRRAYVEYGKKTVPNPDEVATFKRETRRAAVLEEHIARAEKDLLRPELNGRQRDKANAEIRRLNKELNELLKNPDLPEKPGAFATKDEAKQTRIINRMAAIDEELKGIRKINEGTPTAADSVKTEQLRAEKEAMEEKLKEIRAEDNPPISEAQKSLDSALVARERAAQTLDDIASGKLKPGTPEAKEAMTALEEDVRLETDAMKQLAAEMRRDAKPKTDPGYAKEQAEIRALERAIEKYSERTAKQDFTTTGKQHGPDTRRIAELKAIRDSRKAMYEAAKKAGQPVLSPEARRNAIRMKALEKREAEMNAMISSGKFARKPKPVKPVYEKAVIDKEVEISKLKERIDKGIWEKERAEREISQKVWDGVKETSRAGINTISSADFSGLRQGIGAILSNAGRTILPIELTRNASGKLRPSYINQLHSANMTLRPIAKMLAGSFSEAKARAYEARRNRRPNAKSGADKISGMELSDINAARFSKGEEMGRSILDEWAQIPFKTGNLAKTIATAPIKAAAKVVHGSNRGFATLLNELRVEMFDHLLDINFKDRAPTVAELKVIGNLVNIATGRGNLNPKVASVAGKVFWAPSLFTSRLKGLTAEPIWGGKQKFEGTGRARAIAAKDYARVIASGYLLYQLGQLFSDKHEKDPRSSDYGKIVRGKTRVDPWGGFQQLLVAASRIGTGGKIKTLDGKVRKGDIGSQIATFGRNKLRPDWGALWSGIDIMFDNVKPGHPRTYGQLAKSMVTPMSLGDITKIMKDRGMSEGAIIEALSVFGAGVSVYGDDDAPQKQR